MSEGAKSEQGSADATTDRATGADRERQLSPAARRALAEADERRRVQEANAKKQVEEHGGRKGPDPARYGDWEKDGIASDF